MASRFNWTRTILLIVFLSIAAITVCDAQPSDSIDVEAVLKLAEQGDAEAQLLLGIMYEEGDGVPKDAVEAVKWYRLASEQGHSAAQLLLGIMYEEGDGVPKDDAEAVKWFRLAAEQGYAAAQYSLGFMYNKGRVALTRATDLYSGQCFSDRTH